MGFYGRMLKIPGTVRVSNEEMIKKMATKSTYTQNQKEVAEISI